MAKFPQAALQGNAPLVDPETGIMTAAAQQFFLSLWKRTGSQPGAPLVFPELGSDPATPSDGGLLYVKSGALYYIGSSGTITKIANA